MTTPLLTTTLKKGEVIRTTYKGSGSFGMEEDPEHVEYMKRHMKGEFPVGRYEIQGSASFYIKTRSDSEKDIHLSSKVQLEVVAAE